MTKAKPSAAQKGPAASEGSRTSVRGMRFGAAPANSMAAAARAVRSEAVMSDPDRFQDLVSAHKVVPFPHLYTALATGLSGIPLASEITIVGGPGAMKSTYATEILRIFEEVGGAGVLCHAEKKNLMDFTSRDNLRCAILTTARNPNYDPWKTPGKDPDIEDLQDRNPFLVAREDLYNMAHDGGADSRLIVMVPETREDLWGSLLGDRAEEKKGKSGDSATGLCGAIRDQYVKAGYAWPTFMCLDSLQGILPEEVQEAAVEQKEEKGYAQKRAAAKWKLNLQAFENEWLSKWPWTFCVVNHQNRDADGVKSEAGGSFKEFSYILKIELERDKEATYKAGTAISTRNDVNQASR